jgi:hypothetical protein
MSLLRQLALMGSYEALPNIVGSERPFYDIKVQVGRFNV